MAGQEKHASDRTAIGGAVDGRGVGRVPSSQAARREATTAANGFREIERERPGWTFQDLAWTQIEPARVRRDDLLYYVVAAASFIESAAALYTTNLVEHFPDPRARHWLVHYWQPEELNHGRSLRAYVEAVWPELDWERGYAGFFDEYAKFCTVEELEPSRALEMVARCVVETGTSTFYTAIHRRVDEPVLKSLTDLIRQDEVRHYTHFRKFFEAYRREEHVGRIDILGALRRRLLETQHEDAYVGFKHAWAMRHPDRAFEDRVFETFTAEIHALMGRYYPYRMALKMLAQPLHLNRTFAKLAMPLIESAARRYMFN